MRKLFANLLHKEMQKNDDIFLLSGDLGYGLLDEIKDNFPDRFYNVGAAEFLMVGVGIGLTESGKIPICYSITPFLLYRPFELLRTYINHENIPIKLAGSGRGREYSHDGISHWSEDDERILSTLPNIKIYKPSNTLELERIFPEFIYNNQPCYLNLSRFG
jgi:transketolase